MLLALGFVERRMVEDDELCLILEEPNLEDDFDAWSAWFEVLKQGKEELGRFMQGLGVRAIFVGPGKPEALRFALDLTFIGIP